jgi:rubredoxin
MAEDDENLVPMDCACPVCSERNADRLVWLDDDQVECQMCGTVYEPNRDEDEPTD